MLSQVDHVLDLRLLERNPPCALNRRMYRVHDNGEPEWAERFAGRKRPDEPDPGHAGGGSCGTAVRCANPLPVTIR